MPPEEFELLQGAQYRFDDAGLCYMFRDGDSAVLGLSGERVNFTTVQAKAGDTVWIGPCKITVVALKIQDGKDYVHVIVSVPDDDSGRARGDAAVPSMPPEEFELIQSERHQIGGADLAYVLRDGKSVTLELSGATVNTTTVRAKAGDTVWAGPCKITVVGLKVRDGQEYVRAIVSVPGDNTN